MNNTTEPSPYLANLTNYIRDGKKADILYDHQKAIIRDTAAFLQAGGSRGYIEAPTGTGKTVLFVTLAEAFSYQAARPPKILVVTPTKDLVRQTQGGTKGDKGFAGFAPHMSVGTFYSDTPSDMRKLDAQVTITTYASLAKLAATRITSIDEDGKRHVRIINQINEHFDIIFLDEGHKALGNTSREIVNAIKPSSLIIGFTATPEYNTSRNLETLLPHLIHRLDLKEAISLGMLSPVTPVALRAPERIAHEFTTSSLGEYENKSLKQLIYNPSRNSLIIETATQLIETGNTPIIACIPGDTMAHPHHIAEELSSRTITDAKGVSRLIRAKTVTSSISASARQAIYAELENGEIDALTYIDVLTEGWDSQRANTIINARPTRSLVAARQRMGRILRTKADERPAIAIDIIDEISQGTAPQVSMADIFSVESIASGAMIGDTPANWHKKTQETLTSLSKDVDVIPTITNTYTQYAELLETLPTITRGQAHIKQDGKVRTFASPERLRTRFDVDSLALRHLSKQPDVETRLVRRRHEAVNAYDETHIQEAIARLPHTAQTGQPIADDQKYLTLGEAMRHVKEQYQKQTTVDQIEKHFLQLSENEVIVAKKFRARTHRGVTLYTAQSYVRSAALEQFAAEL